MSFLKKFEPEGFRDSKVYKLYNTGTGLARRIGFLNFVFLGIAGLHVYEQ